MTDSHQTCPTYFGVGLKRLKW